MSTTERPDCELAFSFQTTVCGDPVCGLHLIAERSDGTPICEIVIGRAQLLRLLDYVHLNGLDIPNAH